MPPGIGAAEVVRALATRGIDLAWQSRYLRERNWLQIALMGEVDATVAGSLATTIATVIGRILSQPARAPIYPPASLRDLGAIDADTQRLQLLL